MSSDARKIDKFFLISVSILVIAGFIIFLSASMGLLAQDGANFNTVATKQFISLAIGLIFFFILSWTNYHWLHKMALFIFLGAIAVNLLLFIPSLTFHYNGASRWLEIGNLTFQPSELLKIAFIIYIAAWAHFVKDKIASLKFGLLPYVIIVGILGAILLAQRDTDTFLIIACTGLIMVFIAGVRIRHIILALCLIGVFIGGVIITRPYAMDRVKTFLNRGSDTQGSGYQINQSLIAIGSGGLLGRGFGQSVQKFGYLPQPTDDSIFAVAAEEFGFLGSIILLGLYLMLAASIFRIGNRSTDIFGGLLAIGIAVLIITESFMNMAAMLGLIPLSGMPLLFVSHGGTALIITLVTMGIVANISKHTTKSV
ncbi:MAG: putative peptidoglycan glycosyltransferase FtsW [Candidatus Paceibacterota bacterium]|jgi:cell division protein FtsW